MKPLRGESVLVRSLLLFALFIFLTSSSIAQKITPAELDLRKRMVSESYHYLSEVIPVARQNERMDGWLEHLHFARKLFDKISIEVSLRASRSPNPAEVEFRYYNRDQPSCKQSEEMGIQLESVAYTDHSDRLIHLCDRFFVKSEVERAETLMHEHVHIVGIQNECDTEAIAFLTFYAAGKFVTPSYLQRCAVFRNFFDDLIKFDRATVPMTQEENFKVSSKTSQILLRKGIISIEWCELAAKNEKPQSSPYTQLILKKIDKEAKEEFQYVFSDNLKRTVILKCASHVSLTNEKLSAFGLMVIKKQNF